MDSITLDMKVVGKDLKGKAETPTVTLKGTKGEKATFHVANAQELDDFEMEQILTVRISSVQQTLG